MNLKPALLLLGTGLLAAAPAWAGTIPYLGPTHEFKNEKVSMKLTVHFGLDQYTIGNTGFRADPTPAVLRTDSFGADQGSHSWGSSSSEALHLLSISRPDRDIHAVTIGDLDSSGLSSLFNSNAWTAGAREKDKPKDSDGNKNDPPRVQVPEPGSLSLLLLGLVAVGFLTRRQVA